MFTMFITLTMHQVASTQNAYRFGLQIVPSLWNRLPPPLRSSILSLPLSSSLSLVLPFSCIEQRLCLVYAVREDLVAF